MMSAGCYRRIGNTALALEHYLAVHAAHPLNQEAMRFIAQLAAESGTPNSCLRGFSTITRVVQATRTSPQSLPQR